MTTKSILPSIFTFVISILIIQCNPIDVIDDAAKLAALRNVTITYDEITYEIGLPEGALSGASFEALKAQDPDTYSNPANYSITFVANMTANNTATDAEDAKFDGLILDIVMDNITSASIEAISGAIEVPKNQIVPVVANSLINLETHREPGVYIFKQTVNGNDLATGILPKLNYTIGSQQGVITLVTINQSIPTRASDETKAFLKGLLDSGIFDDNLPL